MDKYLKSELVHYLAHSHLAQQHVTALMLPTFIEHNSAISNVLARELNLDSQKEFFRASRLFVYPFYWAKYHLLLLDFLGDPRRSKEFYIDGDKFATLATTFAKYIFTPFMYVSLFSLLLNHIDCPESWSVSGIILMLHLKLQ